MLNQCIEIVMSGLIANYKTKDHPYLTNAIQGALTGLGGFILVTSQDFFKGDLHLKDIGVAFIIFSGVAIVVSLILMFFTYIERSHKD